MYAVVDMNTQVGLLNKYDGNSIINNVHSILRHVYEGGFLHLGAVKTYGRDEVKHENDLVSVKNTVDWAKHPKSVFHHPDNMYFVPNNGFGIDVRLVEMAMAIYFEYRGTNVFHQRYGQPGIISTVMRHLDITDVFLFGVRLNIEIWNACIGLLERKFKVHVIHDCTVTSPIKSRIYPDNYALAIQQLKALNVNIISTKDFLKIEE